MMIEIGPNLTLAIQFVSVVCDVISFVLLLYLWRKSEQLQKENEQLRKALQTIVEEGSGWGQSVALAELKGANDGN